MAKKRCIHTIEMEYSYDRLAPRRLSQVYEQLLPDGVGQREFIHHETIGEEAHEASRDLREGIIRAAESRQDDFEPDRSFA